MKNMTIKDLYEWAIKNNVEDYNVRIQHRDEGGCYCGTDTLYEVDIEINRLRLEVIL